MTGKSASHLFIHVEEPSMMEAMTAWLPSLLAGRAIKAKVIDHGSKMALLTNLPARLKGYASWPDDGLRVLALVDRDNDDCAALKRSLETTAQAAGLATKTRPDCAGNFKVVNRIVIEELEAWFLGDVAALAAAYPGVPYTLGKHAKYRNPDAVTGGTWEALLRVLNSAGHYVGSPRLPKIETARRIAPLMKFDQNRSASFQTFLSGIDALLAA